jgi:8-oxo-dGTP diphosphatase
LWKGDRYLAVQRPEGKIMAGFWEFPGGKLEPGEEPLAALRRELAEELGVLCEAASFWRTISHSYAHGRVRLHVFHVQAFAGEPRALENQRLLWIDPADGPAMNFLPADLPLVRDLQRQRPALP